MQSFKEYISESKDTLVEAKTKYSFKKDVESAIAKMLSIKGEKQHPYEKSKFYNLGETQEAHIHFIWTTKEISKCCTDAEKLKKQDWNGEDKDYRRLRDEEHAINTAYTDCINSHIKDIEKKFGFKWKNKMIFKTLYCADPSYLRKIYFESEVANISDTLTAEYTGTLYGNTIDEEIIFRHKCEEGVETDFKEFPECKVGAIYSTTFGWNMTFVEFYQVVARRGKMVFLKLLKNDEPRYIGFERGYVLPLKGKFDGTTIYRTKVDNLQVNKHTLSLWDGKEEYFDHND